MAINKIIENSNDQKKYSDAKSDIVDKLAIDMINYNLAGRYEKDSEKVLSQIIDECIKYSVHSPNIASQIRVLTKNHLGDTEYFKFMTRGADYSEGYPITTKTKRTTYRSPIPQISAKTFFTKSTI